MLAPPRGHGAGPLVGGNPEKELRRDVRVREATVEDQHGEVHRQLTGAGGEQQGRQGRRQGRQGRLGPRPTWGKPLFHIFKIDDLFLYAQL